jgi:hypothetical protein
VVRVTDSAGNVGFSRPVELVVDRLPPLIGSTLISLGSQLLMPGPSGSVLALAGLDQTVIVSAVGGPTTIDLNAGEQVFSLVKNPETGLWSGTLSFTEPGLYELEAQAVDGAENRTERSLLSVAVLPGGEVLEESSSLDQAASVSGAEVTLYYLEPVRRQFTVWNGEAFGQINPQITDDAGRYQLVVPPGTYYLEVVAPGYETRKSEIFKVVDNLPLNMPIQLRRQVGLVGWLSWLWRPPMEVSLTQPRLPTAENGQRELIGQELPFFTVQREAEPVVSSSLWGRPTVVTVLASWLPQTSEQIEQLEKLVEISSVEVAVIMGQEPPALVKAFQQRGRYTVPLLADRDGQALEALRIQSLPTHVLLDRKGLIKDIVVGVFSAQALLDMVR